MRDKLVTLNNLERAVGWIDAALQGIQGNMPKILAIYEDVDIPSMNITLRCSASVKDIVTWLSQSKVCIVFDLRTAGKQSFSTEIHYTRAEYLTPALYAIEFEIGGSTVKGVYGENGDIWTVEPLPDSGGGSTTHDFTHTADTTVSESTTTITFAASQRNSQMITISDDLGLNIVCNNLSDNYLWIRNISGVEVDITISSVTLGATGVANVYVPSDGISVPAGCVCELGIVVNSDGAFITSRNDLSL